MKHATSFPRIRAQSVGEDNCNIELNNAASYSESGSLLYSYAQPDTENLQLKHNYSESSFTKLHSIKPKQVNLDLSNVGIGLKKLQIKHRQEFRVNKLM